MKMKKTTILLMATAALLCSCARSASLGTNDANKKAFDAWIQVNGYSGCKTTELGSYIIESEDGDVSRPIGTDTESLFVLADYTSRNATTGEYTQTTDARIAQQLGTYEKANFYGPQARCIRVNYEYAGVEELICRMNEGGRVKAVIPGWLMTKKRHDNLAGYLANETGVNTICDIHVVKKIDDIKKWEVDSIVNYVRKNYPKVDVTDTLNAEINQYGMYYIRTGEPSSERTFPEDTTFYINYIGRLMNGQIFDTNVENTAKDAGVWSSDRTYGPVSIAMAEKVSDIKMSGSTVISGFSYPLSKMHPHEKGTVIFYSGYGYKSSGSGARIPPYSPLIFDFEIVDKP